MYVVRWKWIQDNNTHQVEILLFPLVLQYLPTTGLIPRGKTKKKERNEEREKEGEAKTFVVFT